MSRGKAPGARRCARSAPSTDGNGAVKRRTFSPPRSLLPRPIVPTKPAGRPRSAAVQSRAEDLPARTAALRPPRSAPWLRPLRAAALGAAAPPQRDTEFTPRIQPEATPIGDEQRPTGQPSPRAAHERSVKHGIWPHRNVNHQKHDNDLGWPRNGLGKLLEDAWGRGRACDGQKKKDETRCVSPGNR